MTTGILLAGAGSRGICQSGYLQAIHDYGVEYDKLFSSSAGTLNGLMYHAGEMDKLKSVWMNIKSSDVYKDEGLWGLLNCYQRKYIHDSKPLRALLERTVNIPKLRANKKDFFINTTDLTNGIPYTREIKTLTDEELFTFSLASASPPIHFPPVLFEGKTLCDSGVANNYSISDAIAAECDTLILLLASKVPVPPLNNILDLLQRVLSVSMECDLPKEIRAVVKINKILDKIQSAIDHSECSVILDGPDFPRKIKLIIINQDRDTPWGLLDFDYKGLDRQELMNYGYQRALSILQREYE